MEKKGKKFLFFAAISKRRRRTDKKKDEVFRTDTKAHPRKMEEAGRGI